MRISRRISPNPTSLDLVQKVSREVFAPKELKGANIRPVWDDLLPPKWARIQLSVSTLSITHMGRGLSDCEAEQPLPLFPRCCPLPPRHRLEAYATLTLSRGCGGRAELPSGSISTN